MFEKQNTSLRDRRKLRATIKLKDGTQLDGYFFCLSQERITDLLNDPRTFVPLLTIDGRTVLIAKSSIMLASPKDKVPILNTATDPYSVLGVPPEATPTEIKQAYHRRMQEYHPDRFANIDLPEELMILANDMAARITNAYQQVSQKPPKESVS